MLCRIAGWLLMIEGFFMVFPALTSLGYGESDSVVFGATAFATALVGLLLARFSKPQSSHMGKRDGYMLTAMVWVVFSPARMVRMAWRVRLCSTRRPFSCKMGARVPQLGHLRLWEATSNSMTPPQPSQR